MVLSAATVCTGAGTPDQDQGLTVHGLSRLLGARIARYEINNHSNSLKGYHIQQMRELLRHPLNSLLQKGYLLAHLVVCVVRCDIDGILALAIVRVVEHAYNRLCVHNLLPVTTKVMYM